jgi:hypothetical protein
MIIISAILYVGLVITWFNQGSKTGNWDNAIFWIVGVGFTYILTSLACIEKAIKGRSKDR